MWSRYFGSTLYLDSNILIYAVESGNRWRDCLSALFGAIEDRSIRACTSELTLAEVLAKPLQENAVELIALYERVLEPGGAIDVCGMDRTLMREAAALQAGLGLKIADAIHLATAELHGCGYVLTQDERLGRRLGDRCRWLELGSIDG